MQPSHHAVDRDAWEEIPYLGADIDNPGMRAGTEDDQSQIADMDDQHPLVHQIWIRPPRRIGSGSAEMIDTAFLERGYPRDLAAVIKLSIEQKPLLTVVDD